MEERFLVLVTPTAASLKSISLKVEIDSEHLEVFIIGAIWDNGTIFPGDEAVITWREGLIECWIVDIQVYDKKDREKKYKAYRLVNKVILRVNVFYIQHENNLNSCVCEHDREEIDSLEKVFTHSKIENTQTN